MIVTIIAIEIFRFIVIFLPSFWTFRIVPEYGSGVKGRCISHDVFVTAGSYNALTKWGFILTAS